MLGQIRWGSGRKIGLQCEQILGLSVLTLELPWSSRRPERVVRKGAVLLHSRRVRCVLTPPEFPWWPVLMQSGLRPVDTGPLRCKLVPAWVAAQLGQRSIPRETAVVRLKGERNEPTLEGIARELCPLVRSLVLDLPGGERAANRLRRELGIPVLPRGFDGAHLTLRLQDGPVLEGAEITLLDRNLPTDCDRLSLLAVLWETGRINDQEITLKL